MYLGPGLCFCACGPLTHFSSGKREKVNFIFLDTKDFKFQIRGVGMQNFSLP